MRTFFTSDLHFGHVNILNYTKRRQYLGMRDDETIVDMNDRLVRVWNAQVAPEDTVYVLGDFAMGKVAETVEYARQLNGTKHLVMGNHDRPHPIMYKSDEKTAEWYRVYHAAGFASITQSMVYNFDGVTALVHHFPYDADHTDDVRYMDHRPKDTGMPLVHGHVHDMYRTNDRQFNVGIDAWDGQFVTPEEIGAYFRSVGVG